MIHKMVAMARSYPAAVARILVGTRSVAVATRIVTLQARPNAERSDRGPFPTGAGAGLTHVQRTARSDVTSILIGPAGTDASLAGVFAVAFLQLC